MATDISSTDSTVLYDYLDNVLRKKGSVDDLTQQLTECSLLFKKSETLTKADFQDFSVSIVETGNKCFDNAAIKRIEKLVRLMITCDPVACPPLARAIVARADSVAVSYLQARVNLLHLSCVVIQEASVSAQNCPPWLHPLVKSQLYLLEHCLNDSGRLITFIIKSFSKILVASPELVDIYIQLALSSELEGNTFMGIFILLKICKETGKMEFYKSQLLSHYVKVAIEAKRRPTITSLQCYTELIRSMSHEDFKNHLEIPLSKMLKKSPDSILDALTVLTRELRFDMGRYSLDVFIPVIMTKLKSQKDEVRAASVSLLKSIAVICSDVDIFIEIVTQLKALFDGKQGILSQFYQRLAVVNSFYSLLECSVSLGTSGAQTVAEKAVDVLVAIVLKEAHQETRHTALVTLGKWLKFVPAFPASVIDLLSKGVVDSDKSISSSYALACNLVCEWNGQVKIESMSLIEKLLQMVQDAKKKPHLVHVDALLNLDTLVRLANYNSSVEAMLIQDGIFSLFENPQSFFFQSLELIRISETPLYVKDIPTSDESALIASSRTISLIFTRFANQLSTLNCSVLLDALIKICLYPVHSIQKASLSSLSDLVDSGVLSTDCLLDALIRRSDYGGHSNEEKLMIASKIPTPTMFFITLKTILPMHADVSLIPKVLVFSHHPLLDHTTHYTSPKAGQIWRKLSVCFLNEGTGSNSERLDALFSDKSLLRKNLSDYLFQALTAPCKHQRLAACRACAYLIEFEGEGNSEEIILEDVIPAMVKLLETNRNEKPLTMREIAIYNTKEGELCQFDEKVQEKTHVSGTKKRGTADEVWEQEVREELEKKKKKSLEKEKGNDVSSSCDAAQLEEEAVIRERIRILDYQVQCGLEFICGIASMKAEAIHSSLPLLFSSVHKLLPSPLFHDRCLKTLFQLTKCIRPATLQATCGFEITQLLHGIGTDSLNSLSNVPSTLSPLLGQLNRLTLEDKVNLPPPTFHLIFPILHAILSTKDEDCLLQDNYNQAWTIFSFNCEMIQEEEEMEVGDIQAQRLLRRSFISLTLDILGKTPGIHPNPDVILRTICEGPSLSIGEWTEILGDRGMLSSRQNIRLACLHALDAMLKDSGSPSNNPLVQSRLWLSCFDEVEECKLLSNHLWDTSNFKLTKLFVQPLLALLSHQNSNVREASSRALAAGIKMFPDSIGMVTQSLLSLFRKKAPVEEVVDELRVVGFRRENSVPRVEDKATFIPRLGVAFCIRILATEHSFNQQELETVLPFIIDEGLTDSHNEIRNQMMKTGVDLTNVYGGEYTSYFLTVLEKAMDKPAPSSNEKPEVLKAHDHQREGCVVFMGNLGKHMFKEDPKVAAIATSLMDALMIPSESVQRAVANCLAPLMVSLKDQSSDIIDNLAARIANGETYGDRLGAAFGLSAVIKGLGISALKQHNIIPRLEETMQSGKPNARQGALLTFECLCERLGLLFEPYIIVILPILLRSFADTNQHVRDAAHTTAKGIMANLSAHGVKLVLPSLLTALQDNAWRTKQASIQLLGAMAYCAPKQLSTCLPQIVPKLSEAMGDSHPKVRSAGQEALVDIRSVVRNPEIAKLSDVLLSALYDPSNKTTSALQVLQRTAFVHSIDSPSLALIIPILNRGLTDITGDTKRVAALIVGNMCTMINDPKDILPYIDSLLPRLQNLLLDPIPDVRTVTAKAMGMLLKGMGEQHVPDLIPWLFQTVKAESSSVERSGGAQGLCEVLVALGGERLDSTLMDLFALSSHPKYQVREGVLWVIAFISPIMGKSFSVYIKLALPIIVNGLSDESESVRDVAMRAGQVLVSAHGISNTNEILPALEVGLFDDNWRIRHSSVSLLGDLLYRIAGTRAVGMADADDDEAAAGNLQIDRAIVKAIGVEKRNSVLAALYLIRADVSALVRQGSLQVWKSIVANTGKTLKEIFPTLMDLIVSCLCSDNMDKRSVAGRSLGDIVKKLGDRVLPDIIPNLRKGLSPSTSGKMREGVCIGLSEVINSSTKKQLEEYLDTLVSAVQQAISDELPIVRKAAAEAFQTLQKTVGHRAIDEIIPSLLRAIESTNPIQSQRAMEGLQQVLSLRSRDILPYLIPKLLVSPLTIPHLKALSAVAKVTGNSIHHHMDVILNKLTLALADLMQDNKVNNIQPAADDDDEALKNELLSCSKNCLLAVEDVGVQWVTVELCKHCESSVPTVRSIACDNIAVFCEGTTANYTSQLPFLLKTILLRLNDSDDQVIKSALCAMKGINKTIKPSEMVRHIDFIRTTINSTVSDSRHRKGGVGEGEFFLPAFCISGGLEPFIPVFQEGLLYGNPEIREIAAIGLGELILLTSSTVLRPFLIKLTGPLIRIVGDRIPPQVKASILNTLALLLDRGGVSLKPFLPQLQTTFIKAINDPALVVRNKGIYALEKLMPLTAKVEPLVNEICEKVHASNGGVRQSNLEVLKVILSFCGNKMSNAVLRSTAEFCMDLLDNNEDESRKIAAECLSCILPLVDEEVANSIVSTILSSSGGAPWTVRHGYACVLGAVIPKNPIWLNSHLGGISSFIVEGCGDTTSVPVREGSLAALGALLLHSRKSLSNVSSLVEQLEKSAADSPVEVRKTSLKMIKLLAKKHSDLTKQHLATLVPPVLQNVKETNIAIKLAAERCLLYLLEITTRPETLAEYLRSVDGNVGKFLGDYSRRVLSRLKADSGDEAA